MCGLFTPLELGPVRLAHRVVMAPLTRLRSRQPGDVPDTLNALYYGQRASVGGLIITEATAISPAARGYAGAPGIHSPEQVAGWGRVVDAVHARGGRIFLQLWHAGRISHSSLQPDGRAPVAPSCIAAPGTTIDAHGQPVPFERPCVLSVEAIGDIVAAFAAAARKARAAGFDGVELHGANGYLIDQFLRDGANRRRDAYGGSIANRSRFLLEVVDAVADAWEPGRVGVRLSPWGTFNGMSDSHTEALFAHVIAALSRRRLAHLHLIEPRADGDGDATGRNPNAAGATASFRHLFDGPVIAAGGFTPATATAAIAEGWADAIAFGRHFIANPDLPRRLRLGAALNPYDRSTFYGGDARGYTDYPALADGEAEAAWAMLEPPTPTRWSRAACW